MRSSKATINEQMADEKRQMMDICNIHHFHYEKL